MWVKALALLAAPLLALNLTVAWVGETLIFPLSPFHVREKALALARYAAHRPSCLLRGHDDPYLEARLAARKHRLPPGLLEAVVTVESSGRVHRISPAGAMGPGQLMPDTARLLGVRDPYDPRQSLDGSARYLAQELRRYRDVRLAVAAYNAGAGAVKGRVPRNGETEFYVEKVMGEYARRRAPAPR